MSPRWTSPMRRPAVAPRGSTATRSTRSADGRRYQRRGGVIMTDADSAWVDANQPAGSTAETVPVSSPSETQRSDLSVRSKRLIGPARDAGGWDVQDVYVWMRRAESSTSAAPSTGHSAAALCGSGSTEKGWRVCRPTPGRTAPRSLPRSRRTSRPPRRLGPPRCRRCGARTARSSAPLPAMRS